MSAKRDEAPTRGKPDGQDLDGVPVYLDAPEGGRCHAGWDGDCNWNRCPQLRDNEPHATGRHCPLDDGWSGE